VRRVRAELAPVGVQQREVLDEEQDEQLVVKRKGRQTLRLGKEKEGRG
jgi:hypothetical protein